MRELLPRISEYEHREQQDSLAAGHLRATEPDGARTVLLVGNSLLLHGIDRGQLRALVAPGYRVIVYPIEGTTYLDWEYGLRRLFAEGSRPGVVVLCISARHVVSDATNGEGFAHSMMRMSDLPGVVREAHLDMMNVSAYFFANKSKWLGARTNFRAALLERWLPGADLLAADLTVPDRVPFVANASTTQRAVQRLQSLQALAAEHGAGFVYLVPASLNPLDPAPALAVGAAQAGVKVLIPYRPAEMPASAFSDGFHLNPQGATLYTQRAGQALRELLDNGALGAGVNVPPAAAVPPPRL